MTSARPHSHDIADREQGPVEVPEPSRLGVLLLTITSVLVVGPALVVGSLFVSVAQIDRTGGGDLWDDLGSFAFGAFFGGALGLGAAAVACGGTVVVAETLAWWKRRPPGATGTAETYVSTPRNLRLSRVVVRRAVLAILILLIAAVPVFIFHYEDPLGGRGYILDDLRTSGVLVEDARDLWCRGAIDHINTDGCATFVVGADALPGVERAAREWLASPEGTEAPDDILARAHETASRFGMPNMSRLLEPAGLTVIPGNGAATEFWEDLVVLSEDTGRVWHFRFNHMD